MTTFVSLFLITVIAFCAVIGFLMILHIATDFLKDMVSAACRRVFG